MIFGISGPAGSGKDTLAIWLTEHYSFKKLAFADGLKAGLAAMGFPEPANRADKENFIPGFDFTWREAAQTLGTEWGRSLDKDIWVKAATQKASGLGKLVIFTDVRYENEASGVRAIGGKILHLKGRKVDLGENALHSSEEPLYFNKDTDFVLDNSGTQEDLFKQMQTIIDGLIYTAGDK